MDNRARALLFSRYVGLELKGKITARGFTAKTVAQRAERSASAFNRWLNGRIELPLTVLCEACEVIGVDPGDIIDAAYARVVAELGPARSSAQDELDVAGAPDTGALPHAAKRGRRRSDIDPAE